MITTMFLSALGNNTLQTDNQLLRMDRKTAKKIVKATYRIRKDAEKLNMLCSQMNCFETSDYVPVGNLLDYIKECQPWLYKLLKDHLQPEEWKPDRNKKPKKMTVKTHE